MKRFLSILLALAVGFTFTFGSAMSAFAATTTDADAMKAAVNDYATTKITYNAAGYVQSTGVNAVDCPSKFISKAAVDKAVAQLIRDYTVTITGGTAVETGEAGLATAIFSVAADNGTTADEVMQKQVVSEAKAAALASINAVTSNIAAYPVSVQADIKEAAKADAATINAFDEATATYTDVATIMGKKVEYDNKLDKTNAAYIKTLADEQEALAAAKSTAIDAVAAAARTFKSGAIPATLDEDYKVTMDADINAIVANYSAQINAVVIKDTEEDEKLSQAAITDVNTLKGAAIAVFATKATYQAAVDTINGVADLVSYANALAANKKVEYTAEYTLKYNETTVDKVLKETIDKINTLKLTTKTAVKAAIDATSTVAQEVAALAGAKTAAINAITTGTYEINKWSDDNKDAVEAIQKKYTASINAATTGEDIKALEKAAKEEISKYLTDEQILAVEALAVAEITALSYDVALYALATQVKVSNSDISEGTKDATYNAAIALLKDAVVAKQIEYTATDKAEIQQILKDNYSAAQAVINGMKTDTELAAAAKTIIDAITALDKNVTLEGKAAYLAVQEQLEEYVEIPGALYTDISNVTTFKAYMTTLVRLERVAVEVAIDKIPLTVKASDADAVKAARDTNDAYEKAYKEYNAGTFNYAYAAANNKALLEAAEGKLGDAQKTEAAKLITALPTSITLADKAAVDAAKAAYDAMDEVSKAAFDAANKSLVNKLNAAVATIEELEKAEAEANKYTDADAKAFVQDTVVKASSTVKNGKVTVTANADVQELLDNGYTVEFKFYKSTKKSSGYKATVTKNAAESKTYTNTKPAKGANYYKYIIIVTDAEGNVVTKTALKECAYAKRTIK